MRALIAEKATYGANDTFLETIDAQGEREIARRVELAQVSALLRVDALRLDPLHHSFQVDRAGSGSQTRVKD